MICGYLAKGYTSVYVDCRMFKNISFLDIALLPQVRVVQALLERMLHFIQR